MTESSGATVRVLVVDDKPAYRRVLSRILQHHGYEVEEADGGEAALDRLRSGSFDLAYLDVMMPDRNGISVLRELRAADATRGLPVVLVTALDSMDDKVRGLEAGADDFLTKPVQQAELLARTRSLLRVKALQDAQHRAREELDRKNQELQRLSRMREQLRRMVVHDLRNPLTSILAHVQLLRLKPEEERQEVLAEKLRAIERGTVSLIRMVSDLLDVQLMEDGNLKIAAEAVSATQLLRDIHTEFEAEAAVEGKSLELDLPGQDPQVVADSVLVERILANLVVNAVKHTPAGGRIVMRVAPRDDAACFEVEDNGEGIPPEYVERIFDKFEQVELKRLGRKSDRGLGLTFCRMAVQRMQGRIWVQSTPGAGSRFFFTLPLADSATARADRGPGEAVAPA